MKKLNIPFKQTLLCAAIATVVAACGSDSSSDNQTTDISGTGQKVISGPISGFGSVIVNGIHFNTDNTNISVDKVNGKSQSDLEIGQWVTIVGTVDENGEGLATDLEYDETLKGVISEITTDSTSGNMTSLVALGQNISLSATTIIESEKALMVGDMIEVSGLYDADNTLHASFIAFTDDTDSEIQGIISNLNNNNNTFNINGLTVDYSNAEVDISGEIQDGMLVEVEGKVSANILIADSLEEESFYSDLEEDTEVDLEGIITQVENDSDSFQIQGITVIYSIDTEFEDGSSTDILLGAEVEVEGAINAQGQLIATEIEFETEEASEVEGQVTAIDTTASTITINDQAYTVNIDTIIKDDSEQDVAMFSLENISIGDWVEIQASEDFIAVALTREDAEILDSKP